MHEPASTLDSALQLASARNLYMSCAASVCPALSALRSAPGLTNNATLPTLHPMPQSAPSLGCQHKRECRSSPYKQELPLCAATVAAGAVRRHLSCIRSTWEPKRHPDGALRFLVAIRPAAWLQHAAKGTWRVQASRSCSNALPGAQPELDRSPFLLDKDRAGGARGRGRHASPRGGAVGAGACGACTSRAVLPTPAGADRAWTGQLKQPSCMHAYA